MASLKRILSFSSALLASAYFLLPQNIDSPKSVSIASWNLCNFGKKKAQNSQIIKEYANILTNYDIAFLQEIKDSSGKYFQKLAEAAPTHHAALFSKTSSQTERIGVLIRKNAGISVLSFKDFSHSNRSEWFHPPVEITFKMNQYTCSVLNLHTSPKRTKQEISALENIAATNMNSIIIGDLNADTPFYSQKQAADFTNWFWPIKSMQDTTLSKNTHAYDRILMNSNVAREYLSHEIRREGITPELSDHYPISVKIIPQDM